VCTGVFGKRDIGRIEREFLDVLDFELSITENDIMAHHDAIMSLVAPPSRRVSHVIPAALPQLGYSPGSPSSSDASFSPRTPSTFDESSMEVDPRSKSEHYGPQVQYETYPAAPAPVHVAQSRQEKRSSHSSSTFRILRSLPFSRPFGSSSSSSRSELKAPSQNVTQQGRCQLLAPFAAQPPTQVYA